MELVTLSSEAFQELMKKLTAMEHQIEKLGTRRPRLEDEYIDSTEVCRLLHISRKTLERYREKDMIPYTKIKKRIYYRFADLEAFMQRNAHVPKQTIL